MLATLIANAQHNHSAPARRRKRPDICKVHVESYDSAQFPDAMLRQRTVVAPTKPFIVNRLCVVARCCEQLSYIVMKVFVNFESHQAAVGVKGMTVSRANSAAYWIAACTSSRSK